MNRVAIAFSILSTVLVALSFPAQAQSVCYDTRPGAGRPVMLRQPPGRFLLRGLHGSLQLGPWT